MAANNMDREQLQLEAGLLTKGGYEDKAPAQPSNIGRKSSLSLWKLALIAVGIYGLVYLTTAKVWPNRKPCMHNAMGSLVHGLEETTHDQVEESAVTPQGLDEKKFDFKAFKTDIKTSIERIIEKRQATASTPNSAASSQQNTETSQAAPSTSQQPTSSAQPTSAAPTSSERPVTTTQQPTSSAQPTTSQRPSENSSSSQAPTSSARPTTSASQATSSNPPSSQQASSTQQTSSSQQTSQSQPASSTSRQASTSVAASSSTTTSEERSTTSSSSSRSVSSSPVPQTFTRTLASGGVTVVTSTSWVEVVPASGTPNSDNNPDLQGIAGRVPFSIAMSLTTAFFAGFLLV